MAHKLQESNHLPEKPHLSLKKPEIMETLLDGSNKQSSPVALKASALATIESYQSTWIHSYTDGSTFKATINAGYGAVIYSCHMGPKKRSSIPVGLSVQTALQNNMA